MKWFAVGLALAAALAARPAHAMSCEPGPWVAGRSRPGYEFAEAGFPVDAEIWLHVPCSTITRDCSLVTEGATVPLTIETVGEAACSRDILDVYGTPDFLLRLVPAAPLQPNRVYRLECEDLFMTEWGDYVPEEPLEVVTRADASPVAPPGELVVTAARQIRGDASMCGCDYGDLVELAFADLDAAYLREGGRIEVLYDSGEVFPIALTTERYDGKVFLPYTEGPIELTPVAADGTRGATVRLGPEDVDDQLVYIPCRSSLAGPSKALWWLLPVLWIGSRRRRSA